MFRYIRSQTFRSESWSDDELFFSLISCWRRWHAPPGSPLQSGAGQTARLNHSTLAVSGWEERGMRGRERGGDGEVDGFVKRCVTLNGERRCPLLAINKLMRGRMARTVRPIYKGKWRKGLIVILKLSCRDALSPLLISPFHLHLYRGVAARQVWGNFLKANKKCAERYEKPHMTPSYYHVGLSQVYFQLSLLFEMKRPSLSGNQWKK